jgi:phosphatidate phosphatase APP1
MTRLVMESKVDDDGVLHLEVPVGKEAANRTVRVTIESTPVQKSDAEWKEWINRIAGSWEGEFTKPEDLPLEERDPLP